METPANSNSSTITATPVAQLPSLITANGVAYLGFIEPSQNGYVITQSLALGSPKAITSGHIDDYLVASYEEKLTNVNIGVNSIWSQTDFDEDLTLSWEIANLRFKQAITKAPNKVVTDFFRSSQRS
jgi:hypothetical protein